jgi:hypothetical protein
LEEVRFRSGVSMAVATVAGLVIVIGGLGVALRDGAGAQTPAPQTVRPEAGSSAAPSTVSANPTQGEPVPPVVAKRAVPPATGPTSRPPAAARTGPATGKDDGVSWWGEWRKRHDTGRRHDEPRWRHR